MSRPVPAPGRPDSTDFYSVLFASAPERPLDAVREPSCFADLNLDQLVADVAARGGEPSLAPYFYAPLPRVEEVEYRQKTLRDLAAEPVRSVVLAFCNSMADMRDQLGRASRLRNARQREAWTLDAITTYCGAVTRLAADQALRAASPGLRGLAAFLADYTSAARFRTLAANATRLREDLAGVRYTLNLKDSRIRVSRYDGEADFSEQVRAVFEKFRQGAVEDHLVSFRDTADLDHVEAGILELVAELHADTFAAVREFCQDNGDYLDPTIDRFDRDAAFCLAYLQHVGWLRGAGLPFCYPSVTDEPTEVSASDTFDLTLAAVLVRDGREVVRNDLRLSGPERVLVVSGPNQGGKTTFARTFGQLHHLAALGLPVPGTSARLPLCSAVLTHFERQEQVADLRSKLEDELIRARDLLNRATPRSVVVINEIFSATTLDDAVLLSRRLMASLVERGLYCVWVTFIDELSTYGPSTVSMVSTVAEDDPAIRTFKVVRRAADGRAYAMTLAERNGLTYDQLSRRIGS